MKNLLSQINVAPNNGFTGLGKGALANPSTGNVAIGIFSNFISAVIGVMTIVAIIWTIFLIITGAISIIGSGGDKQALEAARKKITTGIIGLIVVIIALLIIDFVGNLFGIPSILNLPALFRLIVV